MTPPRPRPRRLLGLAVAAAVLAVLATAGWQAKRLWDARQFAREVDAVLADFRRQLPLPHGPGLVFEQVAFEGDSLVMLVRAQKRRVGDPDGRSSREQVRQAEHQLLRALCGDDAITYLLARGVSIKRRFIDPDGRLFFEVELTGRDCARPAGGSTT